MFSHVFCFCAHTLSSDHVYLDLQGTVSFNGQVKRYGFNLGLLNQRITMMRQNCYQSSPLIFGLEQCSCPLRSAVSVHIPCEVMLSHSYVYASVVFDEMGPLHYVLAKSGNNYFLLNLLLDVC